MSNYYLDLMNELEADGIDFMPISFEKFPPIIASYTKEEFKNVKAVPKTNYKYWKLVNNKKVYIIA